MSFPMRRRANRWHSMGLAEAIRQLEDLANELTADGLDEEAASLNTTIGDLHWQYEGLIDKELVARWPNGARRPLRTPSAVRN